MLRFLMLLLAVPGWAADVVTNNKSAGKTLVFTEELRFGADEDEDAFLWPGATTNIAVDQAGNIYIADVSEKRILQFDAAGAFVKIIAAEGPGPGELKSLASVQFLADGRLVAPEEVQMAVPRLHYFKADLSFDRVVTPPQGTPQFHRQLLLSPQGDRYSSFYMGFDFQAGKQSMTAAVLNASDNQVIKEFSSFTQGMQMQRLGEPDYLADYLAENLSNTFKGRGVFNFDQKGRLYAAMSNEYKIHIYGETLDKPIKTVTRTYKPKLFKEEQVMGVMEQIADRFRSFPNMGSIMTDAFLQKVVDKTEIPPVAPPVNGIIPMEDGGFLVVHFSDTLTGEQLADIFDAKGTYLGETTLPGWSFIDKELFPRMLFRAGKAYTVETDDLGDNRAVVYSYTLK